MKAEYNFSHLLLCFFNGEPVDGPVRDHSDLLLKSLLTAVLLVCKQWAVVLSTTTPLQWRCGAMSGSQEPLCWQCGRVKGGMGEEKGISGSTFFPFASLPLSLCLCAASGRLACTVNARSGYCSRREGEGRRHTLTHNQTINNPTQQTTTTTKIRTGLLLLHVTCAMTMKLLQRKQDWNHTNKNKGAGGHVGLTFTIWNQYR